MTQVQMTNYVTVTDEITQIVNDENLTMSSKIRQLASLNVPRGQIAKLVNRRYQHVRNVLTTPLKRS